MFSAAGNADSERAKLLEDYWQRKKAAEANKRRGQHDLYGNVNRLPPQAANKPAGKFLIFYILIDRDRYVPIMGRRHYLYLHKG